MGADEFLDTDGDTLSNWFEAAYDGNATSYNPYNSATNPTGTDLDYDESDTDNDGISDADEISGASDPTDPDDPVAYTGPWYVDIDASGGSTGRTWADAFTSIQDAIFAADPGEAIWVAEGTYPETVYMGFEMSLYGGFAGTETLLAQRDWDAHVTMIDVSTAGSGGSAAYHAVTMYALTNARIDGFANHGRRRHWNLSR